MTDNERLASDLERLCCAETEGKFFDLVTDSIGAIIAALRENERLRAELNASNRTMTAPQDEPAPLPRETTS